VHAVLLLHSVSHVLSLQIVRLRRTHVSVCPLFSRNEWIFTPRMLVCERTSTLREKILPSASANLNLLPTVNGASPCSTSDQRVLVVFLSFKDRLSVVKDKGGNGGFFLSCQGDSMSTWLSCCEIVGMDALICTVCTATNPRPNPLPSTQFIQFLSFDPTTTISPPSHPFVQLPLSIHTFSSLINNVRISRRQCLPRQARRAG